MDISKAKSQWREWDERKLSKTFEFDDFVQAMIFVNSVADSAQEQGHHPDIDIRWNKVVLSTTTHDAGDVITSKDLELIEHIEKMK